MSTRARMLRSRLGAALLALCLAPLSGCIWYRGQVWPDPMDMPGGELPPGDSRAHLPGPEEASVLRHSDPVRVRPAGALTGFPLAFHKKRTRLTAGGSVIVAPGGRAEVIWPSGAAVVMFGQGIGWVGSPSRGEPLFSFQDVDSASLDLMPGDRVELLGGSVLTGDSGPYMIDRLGSEVLRVRNQSDGPLELAFRDEVFELDPGQSIRVPLLRGGAEPQSVELDRLRFFGGGFTVWARGPLDVKTDPGGVSARALAEPPGDRQLYGLGVTVRLERGSSAVFRGLGDAPAAPPPTGEDAANGVPAEPPAVPPTSTERP